LIRWLAVAVLLGTALCAQGQAGPTKAELVARLLQMQRPGIEAMTRNIVERPAIQITQDASRIASIRVAPDQRAAVGKKIEASVRKYVDEAAPILRDRALKLAPTTLGAALEEKFSVDELQRLVAWLDSPLNRKYSQLAPEFQSDFLRKLLADAGPAIEPKLQALNQDVEQILTAAAASAPARSASAPQRAASR
jgi:uncharacterized protein